jgi:hypothetical protein
LAFVPRRVKAPIPRLIDPRNRVALSKEVLRALEVAAGDYVTFIVADDGAVHLRKLVIALAPTLPRRPPTIPT